MSWNRHSMRTIKSYSAGCKDLFINRTSRVDPSVSCVDLKTETYAVKVDLWFFLDFHSEDFVTFDWQISWLPVRKRWATSMLFKRSPLFGKHQWSQFSPSNNVILLQPLYASWMWPLFYTLQVASSSIQTDFEGFWKYSGKRSLVIVHNTIWFIAWLISIKRNTSHTPSNYWGLIWG